MAPQRVHSPVEGQTCKHEWNSISAKLETGPQCL